MKIFNQRVRFRAIAIPLMALSIALAACSDDNPVAPDDDPVLDPETEFPVLSTAPEGNVYKQKKSEKRGISTNFRIEDMPALLGSGVSWCYNWAHNPLSDSRWDNLLQNGMTFYPMVWNGSVNASSLTTFPAKDPASQYVLGYNEPNLTDQANMVPERAASYWPNLVNAAGDAGLKIVSPALCYGTLSGYHDPEVWFDEFLTYDGVSLDQMDAIALHAYMPNAEAVKGFVRKFAKYGKPLWLTEFSHANDNISKVDSQYSFMANMITYLEADPAVEKYSWFMDTYGVNATDGGYWELMYNTGSGPVLNDLGKLYIGISSLDKTTWYDVDENIPAEHYSNHSAVESAEAASGWTAGVLPRVTTDAAGELEIYNFIAGTWVEYQVNVPKSGTYRFDIRYATSRDTEMYLSADGVESQLIELPKTSGYEDWTTVGVPVVLRAGQQTIRLTHEKGTTCFNWFRITSPVN